MAFTGTGTILPGVALTVGFSPVALKDAMSRAAACGRLYIDFTVTDTPNGNPRFYGSDSTFSATNVFGGPNVQVVVQSWGDLLKDISSDSESGNATITLLANAGWVPSNGGTSRTVAEWFRQLQIRDVAASIYQWNEESTVQEVIWSGYIRQVERVYQRAGIPLIDLLVGSADTANRITPLSDLVDSTDFPDAPKSSHGQMVPAVYGQTFNGMGGLPRNALGMIGGPMQGTPGVLVDDSLSDAKYLIYFSKHDGLEEAHTFQEPTADTPDSEGDLWVYDSGMGCYGMVDPAWWSFVNDTAYLAVTVDAAPYVWFYVRPAAIGDDTDSSFNADMQHMIDDDLTNDVETTVTDSDISWQCPTLNINGRIERVFVLVDWQNITAEDRKIRVGIWNDYHSAGPTANWLNTKFEDFTDSTHSRRIDITTSIDTVASPSLNQYGYVPGDFAAMAGSSSASDMQAGRFVANYSDGSQKPLELKVGVVNLGGANEGLDGVQVFHMMLVVKVRYGPGHPTIPLSDRSPWKPVTDTLMDFIGWRRQENGFEHLRLTSHTADELRRGGLGTQFFITGGRIKDGNPAVYTDSADSVIFRPCDIANHLIHKHGGKNRNVTSGTLGNFVDARNSAVLDELSVVAQFGPEEMNLQDSLADLTARWPMRITQDSGVYNCIPDDMNPHESRLYRDSSDLIHITPEHIEADTFRVTELSSDDFINAVEFNYAHGYPNREAGKTTQYENKYSQMYFGRKKALVVEEPMLPHQDHLAGVINGATTTAEWYGRRSARPRLLVSCVLSQAFYDLKPGHVVQFKDLERVGLTCPAFRCGLLDYQFKNLSSTTNDGNSLTPTYITTGVTGKIVFMLQQQTDHLDFMVGTAAVHTNVANPWRYGIAGASDAEANFANVINPAAIKSTGAQTVSWDRPLPTDWVKKEISFGAFGQAGPGYPIFYHYTGGSVAGTGSDRTSYEPTWYGRLFEVVKMSRQPVGENSYEGVYAEFMEVM